MRALLFVLALTVGAFAGGDHSSLVDLLGHPEGRMRRRAQKRLLTLGGDAWPALVAATKSSHPEISSSARAILLRGGWIDPAWADVVSAREVSLLRGGSGQRRQKVIDDVARRGERGILALTDIFRSGAGQFELLAVDTVMHRHAGPGLLRYRIRNTGAHAGWFRHGRLVIQKKAWVPFGHDIKFPVRQSRRKTQRGGRFRIVMGRGGIGLGRHQYVNTANEVEWVKAGANVAQPFTAPLNLLRPGVYRVRPRIELGEPVVTLVAVERGGGGIPETRFPLAEHQLKQPPALTIFALPDPLLWGRDHLGVSLDVKRAPKGWHLKLTGISDAMVPSDFSSAWYVALDDLNRVLAHGPLDAKEVGKKSYALADLIQAADAEMVIDGPPRWPKTATGLLFGIRLHDGRTLHGRTVVSRRIRVLDTIPGR